MRKDSEHPFRQFENDPGRHALVELFVREHCGKIKDLLRDCVPLAKGSFGNILGIRGKAATALGLALKEYPRKYESVIAPFAEQQRLSVNIPSAPRIWGSDQADGKDYVIMDEIPGVNLWALPQLQELPRAARLRIFLDALGIVDQYRKAGKRHNDITPSNLGVDATGDMRSFDPDFMSDLHQSDTDRFENKSVGSPAYMAPEAVINLPAGRGPHSDSFSMGATLIAAITGEILPKLLGENGVNDYFFYMLNTEKMQREIDVMLHEIIKDPVLLKVLLRLLHTDPAQRTVEPELRSELESGAADHRTMRYILDDYSPAYRTAVQQWEERMGMAGEQEGFMRTWLRRTAISCEKLIEFFKGLRNV
ncbi:MAG: hypothetical protein HOO67_04240 [Candidatus Peribacteraceae bacterium]|nr:hypothetical protein [Candidatus Peribacteraceae bacterium]